MSEVKFDETTAKALLQTVPRTKPRGVARVYHPGVEFEFNGEVYSDLDALVLLSDGTVIVYNKSLIDYLFEPVAKRTRKATS